MSDTGKAVFLSYASQDAEAAERIADALRAAGVEVWFDQSELGGGDAWDAKIRKQIKDCALLIPIISASTQARTEGYFRLEWRLADQRTHLMGRGRAFLLPVCIDDTKDADADVPDSFSAVQWTRLKGGETTPAFVARVQKLLAGSEMEAGRPRPAVSQSVVPSSRGPSRWWWALPIFGVTMALLLVIKEGRKEPVPAVPPAAPTATAAPAASPPAAAPLTEAGRLIEQAWAIFEKMDDASDDEWVLAEELAEQATKLEPRNAEGWAVYANVTIQPYVFGFDSVPERLTRATKAAQRAGSLDPLSVNARVALVNCYRMSDALMRAEAERMIRALMEEQPRNKRVQRMGGNVLRTARKLDEAVAAYDRALALPGGDPPSRFGKEYSLRLLGRLAEGEALVDQALAANPGPAAQMRKVYYAAVVHDDLARAANLLGKVPGEYLSQEDATYVASSIWMWQRDADKCIAVLRRYTGETILSLWKGEVIGLAYRMSGRSEAARLEWQATLKVVDVRLAAQPNDANALYQKIRLLALLGDKTGAEGLLKTYGQLRSTTTGAGQFNQAWVLVELGRPDEAIAALEATFRASDYARLHLTRRADVRHHPAFDPLRSHPRFQALLRKLEEMQVGTSPAPGKPDAPSSLSLSPSTLSVADSKSVAVLAFANLSDDKANEYFSDGISEELLNVLAKVPGLKVSARTSAFYFKGKEVPIPEIAKQLGVAYVVEGSVRKQGDKVRITAQLIKAADGFHVWSDTFTRDLKDIFAVQDEIAGKIATSLMDKLGVTVPTLAKTTPEAYTLYLQARANLAKRRLSDLNLAKQQFESTLTLDPDYSPARAGLATTLTLLPAYNRSFALARNREFYGRAEREARQVLERDPRNAEAWMALGYGHTLFDWRWKDASEAFARALELAPNDAEVINFAGDHYRAVRDIPRMVAMETRALELNPLNPANHWDLAYACVNLRDYEQAIRHAHGALALSPGSFDAYYSLIWSLGSLKRFEEMRGALVSARRELQEPEPSLLNLEVKAAILEGRTAEALRLQEKITPYAEKGEYSPADHGYHYLLLGESEQAARWLKRACETRDFNLVFAEPIDLERIGADPKTRFVLEVPEVKELVEIRVRNARAAKGQK